MASFSFSLLDQPFSRPVPIAVAAAAEADVLRAVLYATERGIVVPHLVGDAGEIRRIAKENGLNLDAAAVVNVPDVAEAARTAVALVAAG